MKNSKFKKVGYVLFVVGILGIIGYGALIVYRNANISVNTFTSDGYALYLKSNNIKAETVNFKNGDKYKFKKYDNVISIDSDSKSSSINDDSLIHYQNGGLIVLKNTVGIDLDKIGDEIILYYNLYKNTEVKYDSTGDEYYVDATDKKITFKKLLLRINDNKYLLTGSNIRAVLFNEQIVDFGNYLYVEYVNGSVIRLYNNEKYYQTISSNSKIVNGNITIDLGKKIISKDNNNEISLTNLIIDRDALIDVITDDAIIEDAKISTPNISKDILDAPINNGSGEDSSNNEVNVDNNAVAGNDNDEGNTGENNPGDNSQQTEEVDQSIYYKEPVFKLTSLSLTALKIDATVEITDDDGLIINPVKFSIVENTTANVVYEDELTEGNVSAYISYPNLKPDTEYTLYGKASYKVDDITLEKSFISKIFRTEALGVSFRKSYVTKDSIYIDLYREKYSKVNSVNVGIFDDTGTLLDYQKIDFTDISKSKYQLSFNELEHNKTYVIKMYDILSSGVVVDDGYSQIETIKTLKKAPIIGDLTYRVNKPDALFELSVSKVVDEDYGAYNYRYEVFDARSDLSNDAPILSIEQKQLGPVSVVVDDSKIHRGVAYTYRFIVEFNDNEKNVYYTKDLGTVMQLDGVEFPKLRWEETHVTWEQINGSIVIDDTSGAIQSNVYKVVYKNSIDLYTVDTIVTETPQNVIPINVNYLRANETYTFDVYASINLQDNNPTATQTYIGSVNVQTKNPNSFHANFNKTNSYSDVFSINFSLSDESENASFEASTLTSLNFTLYQGSTTDGKVEVFKKKIDLNDDEYISSLKQMFYDDSAIINADFFDSDNADFHQKTYTLVVDGAYDYTGYESNIIPIENNVFQFDVNNYIPELPDSDEIQITTRQIVNRLATSFGLEYDNEIDPNTVVGINAIASYDNNSNSARYIIYHVWKKNYQTNKFEKIDSLDKKIYFNNDGTLSSTVIPVFAGTKMDVNDIDELRRGNEYFLSYEAFLDTNNDGEIDTIYPTSIDETVVLKSDTIKLRKQSSKFYLYPSVSGANYMTWKYKYTDYDNALNTDKLYGYINANANYSSSPDISLNEEYQVATFDRLTNGNTLTIKKEDKLVKSDNKSVTTLTSQYFYGYISSTNLTYNVTALDNVITLSIDDYINKSQIIDSISSINVLIEPVNADDLNRLGTKLIENVNLRGGKITLDYFDISEYYDIDIALSLIVNYDTGELGFDYDSPYLALQNGTYAEVGNYYTMSGQRLMQVSSFYGNALKLSFDDYSKILNVTNNSGRIVSLSVDINETGVVYDNNNLIVKNIREERLSSNENVIKFDYVIPGISIYDSSNHVDIVPILTGAYVNAKLKIFDNTVIKDNLVYFDLYETNANGTNAQFVETLSHTIDEFEDSILIDNLKHQTNYYIKVYSYVYDGDTGEYKKEYFYDIDQQSIGCIYNFHTLSDVGIKNVKVNFITNSYSDKRLSIDYELENVLGFNYIKYTLYKKTQNGYEEVDINIPNATNFFKNMHLQVNASPNANNEIVYGGEYMLNIKAYGEYTLNGQQIELKLGDNDTMFTIDDYEKPYVGISSGKSEGQIYFRVTITDPSHVISRDVYDVKLLDSNNNVVASSNNISVNTINRRFVYSSDNYDLINGEIYTFDVTTRNDYNNTGQNLTVSHKRRSIQFGSEIDLGTVVFSGNDNNSFDLVFSDSYRLTEIDHVSYSISSVTTGFYTSGSTSFNVRYDSNNNLYTYTIDLSTIEFASNNVYLFTFNFYDNNNLVNEIEFDYYNGGSDEETP